MNAAHAKANQCAMSAKSAARAMKSQKWAANDVRSLSTGRVAVASIVNEVVCNVQQRLV